MRDYAGEADAERTRRKEEEGPRFVGMDRAALVKMLRKHLCKCGHYMIDHGPNIHEIDLDCGEQDVVMECYLPDCCDGFDPVEKSD